MKISQLRIKILSVFLALPISAHSFEFNKICHNDSMQFQGDKKAHLAYSAGIGAVTRSVIKDPWIAFGVALIPGLYRESFNSNSCFSKEDMVYNIVGAAIGVATTNWIITPNKVFYRMEF